MTTPAPLLEPAEYPQFLLRERAEILFVLKSLMNRLAQITVFFDEGKEMLLTAIAAVAEDHLILDASPSAESNRKALAAPKLFCVTSLDKVRVQFILRGLAATEFGGRPAFRAALPEEVLRLQRREFYRLELPVMRPLYCQMPIPLPEGKLALHEAQVLDLSCGGLGLSAPREPLPFAAGMRFSPCRLELPEVGFITATVELRHLFEVSLRNGTRIKRAGGAFIDLPGPQMTLIQRYIIKVERERKARAAGLA
ncbi:MAG: flagellar brake protein [Rhodocyclaceae bacterium]|nr:flagellar brake protein [Rhodocyclaceae bacterium]